jgi:hypothetical protein
MNDSYKTKQIKKSIYDAEKTTIDKVDTKFLFSREFIDFNGERNSVTINLIIDYLEGTFKILPVSGDMFNFNYCNPESVNLHRSILYIMQEAYDFGVKEINNEKTN